MTNQAGRCMPKYCFRVLAFCIALTVAACSKVTPENYQKVESGMTRDQVYAILGEPDEVSGGGVGSLTMSAERWEGRTQVISVTFGGEKVVLKSIDERQSE